MRDQFERTAERADDDIGPASAPPKRPVITLDVSLYETYLEDSGMTDDQKRQFLEALWSIIVGFVDLGFGVHPVQQALESGSKGPAPESGGRDAARPAPAHQEEKDNEQTRSLREEIARGFAGKEDR